MPTACSLLLNVVFAINPIANIFQFFGKLQVISPVLLNQIKISNRYENMLQHEFYKVVDNLYTFVF